MLSVALGLQGNSWFKTERNHMLNIEIVDGNITNLIFQLSQKRPSKTAFFELSGQELHQFS